MDNILEKHWDIPIEDIIKHYENSRKNYEELAQEGGELHIAYYRDKHPIYYQRLVISQKRKEDD